MKIVFIAGSNRGKESASEKLASLLMSPADQSLRFEILEIGKYIKVLDENQNFFDSYIRAMHDCDAIIWLVPIRNLLPSYEICRFIDIINRKNAGMLLKNKYTSAVFTSFFFSSDDAETALAFTCQSWGMFWFNGFHCLPDAADSPAEVELARYFFSDFLHKVKNNIRPSRFFAPNIERFIPYTSVRQRPISMKSDACAKILLITADADEKSNLSQLIDIWGKIFPFPAETINLSQLRLCFSCAGGRECFTNQYCNLDSDSIGKTIYQKYKEADVVIFADDIRSGIFSPPLKLFLDRIFMPAFFDRKKRKLSVWILSGNLKSPTRFDKYIRIKSILHGEHVAGIVSDEDESSKQITDNLIAAATETLRLLESPKPRPTDGEAEKAILCEFQEKLLSFSSKTSGRHRLIQFFKK